MNHFALLFHEFVNLLYISTITSYLLRNLPKNIFFLTRLIKVREFTTKLMTPQSTDKNHCLCSQLNSSFNEKKIYFCMSIYEIHSMFTKF